MKYAFPLNNQHPSKKLAEWLHSSRPDLYRDANHKPEMCVALTSFEALCGFRNDKEISQMLRAFPELRTVVGMVDNVADSEASMSWLLTVERRLVIFLHYDSSVKATLSSTDDCERGKSCSPSARHPCRPVRSRASGFGVPAWFRRGTRSTAQ